MVKTTLTINTITIPISVYKTVDEFGLPGQLYHYDCGGKVHLIRECENHPGDHEIVTYSGIQIDDHIEPIDSALRAELLDRHSGLEIVGARPTRELPDLLGTTFMPLATYEVTHQRNIGFASQANDLLITLLSRMKTKKKYLILTCPAGGMLRYCILLPNGRMMTLAYSEEIRESDELSGVVDRDAARIFDSLLNTNKDIPIMTLNPFYERIDAWVKGVRRKVKLVNNTKKAKEPVGVS